MVKNDDNSLTPTSLDFKSLGIAEDSGAAGESHGVSFAEPMDAADDASDGGGGLADGVDDSTRILDDGPITLGVSVAHIIKPNRLCLGSIGRTNTKFCILEKGQCTVQSHKVKSIGDMVKPGLYCLEPTGTGPNESVCLLAPTVKRNLLSALEFRTLMSDFKDTESLRDQFTLFSMRSDAWDSENQDAITALNSKVDNYKTPKKEKIQIGSSATYDYGDFGFKPQVTFKTVFDNYSRRVEEFNPETAGTISLDTVGELGSKWSNDIEEMKVYLREQGESLENFAHEVTNKLLLVDGLVTKYKTIEGKIGSQSELLKSQGTEPVLWNAIAGLVDSGNTLLKDQTATKQRVVKHVNSQVKGLENNLTKILRTYKSKIEGQDALIQALEENQRDLIRQIGGRGNSELSRDGSYDESKVGSGLHGLSFLNTPDANPSRPATSTPSTATRLGATAVLSQNIANESSTPGIDLATVHLLEAWESRLTELENFKRSQDDKLLEEAVRIIDLTLTCKDDVERWYIAEGPNPDAVPLCGLFIDPLIALYWIGTRIDGGGGSRTKLDNLLRGRKLDMTELEMGAYESFASDIPTVFTGESKERLVITDEGKTKLANMPNFEAWHYPGREKGLCHQIENAAHMVKDALKGTILNLLEHHEKARGVALDMLETSFAFVHQLSSYITGTMFDFRALKVGTEKEIWNLITFVVEHLFKNDFAKARHSSITRLNAGNRDSGFVVMWCSFKSVSVAQTLMRTGISDSPSVSASYVRFVLTQSNMGKLTALEEENKQLKTAVEKLKSEVDSIKTQARDAKRTADSAISKIAKKSKQEGGKA